MKLTNKRIIAAIAAIAVNLFVCVEANNSLYAEIVNYKLNVNGDPVSMSTVNIDGSAYVPLRELAQALDYDVYWNGDEEKVSLFLNSDNSSADVPSEEKWQGKAVYDGDEVVGFNWYYCEDRQSEWSELDKREPELKTTGFIYGSDFKDGYAFVEDSSHKYGYIDTTGKIVIPLKFSNADLFWEGLAAVTTTFRVTSDPEWGFIDETGELVIPCRYPAVKFFSEGVCAVSEISRYGPFYFIDKNGNKLFDGQTFIDAFVFSDGMCKIKTKGTYRPNDPESKYSYISIDGEISDKEWDLCGNFENGTAIVEKDGQKMRIDKNFEVVEYID